ncbi:DUF2567 domain-containing protein [Micromonospora humi]|uniref:DUF2567 domain-containing protein n=1 Tax=Micromonospora humi TaxID=745366 RepID=A0A1C5HP43_9ACTN|nr:DUF2567 domain-containing protein [Micromonospora humi]SCG47677.1 Protein of unknown function [Micromonospora humi]
MSPDTPDPERTADRPRTAGRPPAEATPAGPPAAPARPTEGTTGTDGPAGHQGPTGRAPGAEPWAGHPPGPFAPSPGTTVARRGGGRAVTTALGVTALLTVLGVPLGLLWAWLAPGTPVRQTPDGAVYAVPQPEQPIAADGWFSLLALGFGVLTAIALWVLLRRGRGPLSLLAATLGGLGAAVVAWQVGRRIGLATFQRLVDTAPPGTDFTKPAELRAGGVDWFGPLPLPHGNLLLAAFGAAVTYTLLAGWSRWPSLRPEPEPDGDWPPGQGGWPAPGVGGYGPPAPEGGRTPPPGISSAPEDPPAR